MVDALFSLFQALPIYAQLVVALGVILGAIASVLKWGGKVLQRMWPGREIWGADGNVIDPPGEPNSAVNAYTGGIATRWTTWTPQYEGMYFRLDLGRVATIERVAFEHARSFEDYPEGYSMDLSSDGSQWETKQGGGPIDQSFAPMPIRYIRVTITKPHRERAKVQPYWWSIHNIKVYERRLWGLWVKPI